MDKEPVKSTLAILSIFAGLICFLVVLKDSFYLNLSSVGIANKTLLTPLQLGSVGFVFTSLGIILLYIVFNKK